MTFNSLNYVFIFLPVTVIGYYLLRRTPLGNLFMACGSSFFYAVGAIGNLMPMLLAALISPVEVRSRQRLINAA